MLHLDEQRVYLDGSHIALTNTQFDLLRHIAERRDTLVSKEELLEAVWPDRIVTEQSIKAYVKDLRRLLGDTVYSQSGSVHRDGARPRLPIRRRCDFGESHAFLR